MGRVIFLSKAFLCFATNINVVLRTSLFNNLWVMTYHLTLVAIRV
ncbi:hypothetical protein SAMN03080594_107136 [Arenibacter palladensis]|uniref:Uncharacterized protein n=1 Tax=Arenibacter palladensis TaxID=237373 RepID=A0A1M5EHF1_9FLAO|nr:hypothetical protein SAMN03080594_107136 [Arenibacter palladensis]